MILNLTQVTSGKLSQMPFKFSLQPRLSDVKHFGIIAISEFDIEGVVNKSGSELLIDFTINGELVYQCSRCLEDVSEHFCLPLHKRIIKNAVVQQEDEESGSYIVDEYELPIGDLVVDEILMALPLHVVCDENCKGLCPQCGINLNHESCSCSEDKIDPRMEILKNYFKQD